MEKNYADIMQQYALPDYMVGAVERYVLKGIAPGGFLTAVLSNDLAGAVGRADSANAAALVQWVKFVYNELPSSCWREAENVEYWCKVGGLEGLQAAMEA